MVHENPASRDDGGVETLRRILWVKGALERADGTARDRLTAAESDYQSRLKQLQRSHLQVVEEIAADFADARNLAAEVENAVASYRNLFRDAPRYNWPAVDHADVMNTLERAVRRVRPRFFPRRLRKAAREAKTALAQAEQIRHRAEEAENDRYEQDQRPEESRRETAGSQARQEWETAYTKLLPRMHIVEGEVNGLAPKWESAWDEWHPPRRALRFVRLGQRIYRGQFEDVHLPAVLPILSRYNLFVHAQPGADHQRAFVLGILLRMLSSFPAGTLRFTFVDAYLYGNSSAPMMRLREYEERLVGSNVWTDPREIEEQLGVLLSRIEEVTARNLRGEYDLVVDYNERVGSRGEPYRVLVVYDYPHGFTSPEMHRRLTAVINNGPRCGIYTILVSTREALLEAGLAQAEAHVLTFGDDLRPGSRGAVLALAGDENGEWASWQNVELEAPPKVRFDPANPGDPFTRVLQEVGRQATTVIDIQVGLQEVFDMLAAQDTAQGAPRASGGRVDLADETTWWRGDATSEIALPIGAFGEDDALLFELGSGTSQHSLVAGQTGSGKTNLLHDVILAGALLYHPDDFELYLVDLKQGVGFQDYARCNLPHARLVAINSDREFGVDVLDIIVAEKRRRGDLFQEYKVDTLAQYRAKPKSPDAPRLPRILLVIDEFHELVTETDAITQRAAIQLANLTAQGRAFGIHVLLSSQSLASARAIPSATFGQMQVRVALQCTDADSRLILAEDNPGARMLGRPGEAIYNTRLGLPKHNRTFQAAYCSGEQREDLLRRLAAHHVPGRDFRRQPRVYEGDAPGRLHRDDGFRTALPAAPGARSGGTRTPASTTQGAEVTPWPLEPRLVLGEPMGLGASTTLDLRRADGANLLYIGSDRAAVGHIVAVTASLAAQSIGRPHGRVVILDCIAERGVLGAYTGELTQLAPMLEIAELRQFADVIAEFAAVVDERQAFDGYNASPHILIVHGLQAVRALDAELLRSYDNKDAVSRQFGEILANGPVFGVHVFVTADSPTALRRRFDRRLQREFENLVVRRMDEEDGHHILHNARAAANLRRNQALLVVLDQGRLEKFRPYTAPPPGWITEFAATLPPCAPPYPPPCVPLAGP